MTYFLKDPDQSHWFIEFAFHNRGIGISRRLKKEEKKEKKKVFTYFNTKHLWGWGGGGCGGGGKES